MLLCCNRLPQGPSYQTSRVQRPETNSIQLIELAGWTLTTVNTFLKQLDNVDNEWHTGSLHTGVFAQFDSGSHSKGESQSISLGGQRWSWRSTLDCLLDNQSKTKQSAQQISMIVTSGYMIILALCSQGIFLLR